MNGAGQSRQGSRGFTVLTAVLLQIGAVLALALGAALVSGWSSAWYVVLGGSAAIIPNSLFALRLALHQGRSPESYPVVFFLGQFAKIGLTAFLLVAIHKWLGPLQWLPLLLGLIVALKAPLFALLYVRSLTGQENEKPAGDRSAVDSPGADAGGDRRPGLEGMESGSTGTSSVGSSSIRKSSIRTSIREIATSDNSR
jgi:ATP synthase protein I